jgi:siroheme synthase (precorrin-2 oxidase/ferrochelatase)
LLLVKYKELLLVKFREREREREEEEEEEEKKRRMRWIAVCVVPSGTRIDRHGTQYV